MIALKEPVTLGPFGAADNGTIWTIMMIFDQLVEYAPGKLDPQPGIAKSWEFSNGGKTITFHLRDAKFSNGSPVTADDVVFSLNRFKDPKVNNLLPFLATSIASVSAPNGKTDLDSIYLAAEKVDVNGTINDMLYVGYLSCATGNV